ncbi:MAG: ABC transporter ATP-binding protein [Anaerolineales bacterium]|nr:ABC transporter ATP-binding protein [Anaerolineales bacterium]
MARIVIENAYKTFGDFVAVNNVSLTVNDQEFVVLVGPSGCGKTTLLRAVAGLGIVDSGKIMIGDRDVTYLSPKDRKLSMVFQSYAIFPHMKVYNNIAFGLRMQRVSKAQIEERVQEAARLLHIENLLNRYPSQMSGGQRQRVAVARAIAMQSEVLLMDEPLSNLDALLRLEMRAELKSLLAKVGATTIYVTHDQIEAMSMGDRIAVMRDGEILQFDSPTRIYDFPATQFVGGFIGTPPMNFLEAQIQRDNGQLQVKIGEFTLSPPNYLHDALRLYEGQVVLAGIRAESMEALDAPAPDTLGVTVEVVEPLGSQNLLTIRMHNNVIKVSTHPTFPVVAGKQIWIRFPIDKIRWMNRDSGQALPIDLEKIVSR